MGKATPFNLSYDTDIDHWDLYHAAITLHNARRVLKLWFAIAGADTLEERSKFRVRIHAENPDNGDFGSVCIYYDNLCIDRTSYRSHRNCKGPSCSRGWTDEGIALWNKFKDEFLAKPPSFEELGKTPEEFLKDLGTPWTGIG